ncbi:MAG TPA: UbiD family decarboxylase [Aggregatilineales bacterium]|nr:UbiD family decarboxylase [Aggregatilineales bacterium]
MAYKGLDEFLIRLEQARCLTSVRRRFESLEAAMAHAAGVGRGVRFENVEGSPYPIVTGLFASERQMAWALGLDDLDALGQRLDRLLDPRLPTQFSDLMARAGDLLGAVRLGTVNARGSGAKTYESIRAPVDTLQTLPARDRDAVRSLPGAMLFYRIGEESRVDWVRGRVIDSDRVTLEGFDLSGGTERPAALVWGSDPALMWAAGLRLPQQISPLWLAGWLRGKPVPLVSAQTQAIEIPADAELVFEGALTGTELRVTGGLQRTVAVLPVIERAPASDRARDMVIGAVLRLMWPQVAAVRTVNNLLVVALSPASLEASQQVIFGVWALRMTAHVPVVLMMDAAADVLDDGQVARAAVRALARPEHCLSVSGSPQRVALDGRTPEREQNASSGVTDKSAAAALKALSNLDTLEGRLACGADGRVSLDLGTARTES